MKTLIPKILKTDTKKGDHTLVRKLHLEDQIIALSKQQKEIKKMDMDDIFNAIAKHSFIAVLKNLEESYRLELIEYLDRQDQYNDR
jgi:hypothetical protein